MILAYATRHQEKFDKMGSIDVKIGSKKLQSVSIIAKNFYSSILNHIEEKVTAERGM